MKRTISIVVLGNGTTQNGTTLIQYSAKVVTERVDIDTKLAEVKEIVERKYPTSIWGNKYFDVF